MMIGLRARQRKLFEIIEEGCNTLESRFALSFDLDFKLDFGFANTAEVADGMLFGGQTHSTSSDDGLSEAHFVHSIVDEHLDVVHLDDLLPQMG